MEIILPELLSLPKLTLPPKRHRILIVDDDQQDRQAVIRALQRKAPETEGVEIDVLEANTLAQAWEELRGGECACVFLNRAMPDGTALDLLMEMRSQGIATPVVVLTGERDEQTVVEVMQAGAVDYLPKNKLSTDLVARSLRAALLFLQAQHEKQAILTELHTRDRAIAAASNGIVIADARLPDYPLVYINAAFLRLTGYAEEEVIGRNCRFLSGAGTDPVASRVLRESLHQGRDCQVLILNYRKDRTTFRNEVSVSPIRDAGGALTHFVGIQTDVTARYEADGERERLLSEEHARAEREALLNRIGAAIRSSTDPARVLDVAVEELGKALGADRCYYAAYDQEADTATVGFDWHREPLPSFTGQYQMSRFAINRDAEYKAGRTQVAMDTCEDPAILELGLRALVRVPLVAGTGMTALAVAMIDGPRRWTPEEVSLVEAVATQTQTALEAARLRLREHRITEQLQSALQPPLPASVPGLALAAFYRPAWEDHGVGGDFSDVFSDGKGMTFLVVGDLSGKGLAAASQVALVRNMLRFALYNGRTLAGPVSSLNATLAGNSLLDGFTTLFVGRYDAAARTLTYVNCGQDAGLVLRAASGQAETLSSTGPVLGMIPEASYTEKDIALAPEDILALFTDGLTEAGPTRTTMLAEDGVRALLEQQRGQTDPQVIVERMMAEIDAYTGAGVRDDQCLLVSVVTGLKAL